MDAPGGCLRLVVGLEEVGLADLALVGGKNASLGELIRQLGGVGVRVPPGFATTAHAWHQFLAVGDLEGRLRELLAGLDVADVAELGRVGRAARALILETPFPPEVEWAIVGAYRQLCEREGGMVRVAVRSSATAEDLPDASFAGQQETFLGVSGEAAVLAACKKCFASLFTDRAISYRQIKGFDHFSVALSVGVQVMVRSDLASAGVIFTLDPESGFRDAVLVTGAWGLGELVVQGTVNPDEVVVHKPTLAAGFRPIVARRLGSKAQRLVYAAADPGRTVVEAVAEQERNRPMLSDEEVLTLARWAVAIEAHYSRVRGADTPMDIEWAKDGLNGRLYIVQARPETVHSQRSGATIRTWTLKERGEVLVSGRAVGGAIGRGPARRITDLAGIHAFQPGEVLVTGRTDPDWEPIMKQAAAIVTDQGGRTCHAAIIARELGIPAVVGTGDGTARIETGQPLTVSCAEGEEGHVYAGLLSFDVDELTVTDLPRPRTQVYLNIGNPEEAFALSALPVDGVGLARLEFIIANHIGVHPLALLHPDHLDSTERARIGQLTRGYAQPAEFFVDRLAQGVATIAAAFFPRPVIVRLSDFKTNEYAHLLSGTVFEPEEENPMLGLRGASRYTHPRYREGFALECRALKRVRDEMGLTNLIVMVPFCRTPEEGRRVLAEMAANGLVRGENGLQVYVMCELPANVILADRFSEVFDGFSIGSNDLTQLTLGLDRDSAQVAGLFDERDEAVRRAIAQAIRTAKGRGRKIGICGQAPSDYPEFARFLVEEGIDSISLNPDAVVRTLLGVAEAEREIGTLR
jgi:pyruvate,water dikinase